MGGDANTDPRTDRREGTKEEPKHPEAGKSESYPAPGGAGSGTKDDPSKSPDAGAGPRADGDDTPSDR